MASTSGSGSARRRLCLTISDHVAVDLKHANAWNHPTSTDVATEGSGVDLEQLGR